MNSEKSKVTFSSPISAYLDQLRNQLLPNTQGTVASYIPELSNADPMSFGIAIATLDGTTYQTGDALTEFSIQSMSKPFTYGQALFKHGPEAVLRKVGVEPTGEAFNSIVLDDVNNRPFNPMVNAGSIAVADLLCHNGGVGEMLKMFSRLAGRELDIDEAVFLSELKTGHRNRAIAYMMLNSEMIDHDPEEVLDLYFRQCAINVTCKDMAVMAACLANRGKNPLTGDQVFVSEQIEHMLTIMNTCGMYDYAGQWAYEVGIPAKSGVSGGIIAIIPGQAGIAVWSPPLDVSGNSVRGVEVCKAISQQFCLHAFSEKPSAGIVIRRQYRANEVGSKRIRSASALEWLSTRADRIYVMELQGALYFGSSEEVIRGLAQTANNVEEILIDFRRVSFVDPAATGLLVQALEEFREIGLRVTLSALNTHRSVAGLYNRVLEDCQWIEITRDIDTALESAEGRLLKSHKETRDITQFSLSGLDIFAGLEPVDYRLLESIVVAKSYSAGQQIIAEGDPADAFFAIARGTASISILLQDGRRRRLTTLGPGSNFGETALIDGGVRSADVHADEPVVAYLFTTQSILALSDEHPKILEKILSNIVRSLVKRINQANAEIRNLE